MPKFLVEASYTTEGLKGLQHDRASGRLEAVTSAVRSLGGALEAMYFALGADDVIVVADLPDAVAAAALSTTIAATGLARPRTVALLSVAEMDEALGRRAAYRGPGQQP